MSAILVCLPNGFVKNCLASTHGECEQTSQWCRTNILWHSLNYRHQGTLPDANEGIHHCPFTFAVPSTYIHFRRMNAFVRYTCTRLTRLYTEVQELFLGGSKDVTPSNISIIARILNKFCTQNKIPKCEKTALTPQKVEQIQESVLAIPSVLTMQIFWNHFLKFW